MEKEPKEKMCILKTLPCMKAKRPEIYSRAKTCKNSVARRCKEEPTLKFCKTAPKKGISRLTKKRLCSYVMTHPQYSYEGKVLKKDFQGISLKKNFGQSVLAKFFTPMEQQQFTGGYIEDHAFLLYLAKYFKAESTLYMQRGDDVRIQWTNWDDELDKEISENPTTDVYKLLFPSGFESFLKKYKKSKRYIFALMRLYKKDVSENDVSIHANFLMIDTHTKTLYRYEPSGYGLYEVFDMDLLDDELAVWAKEHKLKYFPPWETCPRQLFGKMAGLQRAAKEQKGKEGDPGGFCKVWTTFMLEQKLRNPDIDFDTLHGKLLKEFKEANIDLTEFARMYTARVNFVGNELMMKHGFRPEKDDGDKFLEKHWKALFTDATKE